MLFLVCGLAFYQLTATQQGLQGFQAMYYISSVFAQFVNATTFLLVGSCQLIAYCLTMMADQSASSGFHACAPQGQPYCDSLSSLSLLLKCIAVLQQASELFPTENRGMAHGISAAVGKLGALSADVIMGQVIPGHYLASFPCSLFPSFPILISEDAMVEWKIFLQKCL